MNKREARSEARRLAAQILERERTHGTLISSVAEDSGMSKKDRIRLDEAYRQIIEQLLN